MLEAFKREADKRIGRLEVVVEKSNAASFEALACMRKYCESPNDNIDMSEVLNLLQDLNKMMKSFGEAMLKMNEKIDGVSLKLESLGSGCNAMGIKEELQILRSDLKKNVATYEFIRKNKDIAGSMAFFRSENGDGTLFDESEVGAVQRKEIE